MHERLAEVRPLPSASERIRYIARSRSNCGVKQAGILVGDPIEIVLSDDQLSGGIPHRDGNRCRVHIHADVFATIHRGAPF